MKKLIIFLVCILSIANAETIMSNNDSYKDSYRYHFVYSYEFAKQHELPKKNIETLSPNLWAMELICVRQRSLSLETINSLFPDKKFTEREIIEINEIIPALEVIYKDRKNFSVNYQKDCYIALYLKNNLNIDYPEKGKAGNRHHSRRLIEKGLEPIKHELQRQHNENSFEGLLSERQAENAKKFEEKAYIVEKSERHNKKFYHPLLIDNFKNEVFADVDYIEIGPDERCKFIKSMKEPVLLLKRHDLKDGYYEFLIPKRVTEGA